MSSRRCHAYLVTGRHSPKAPSISRLASLATLLVFATVPCSQGVLAQQDYGSADLIERAPISLTSPDTVWASLTKADQQRTLQSWLKVTTDAGPLESMTTPVFQIEIASLAKPIAFMPETSEDFLKSLARLPGFAIVDSQPGFAESRSELQRCVLLPLMEQQVRIPELVASIDRAGLNLLQQSLNQRLTAAKLPSSSSGRADNLRAAIAMERLAIRALADAQLAEEAHLDALQIMPLNVVPQMFRNARMVVWVGFRDTDGGLHNCGSGFLYKGMVITAAHLFSKDDHFWPPGATNSDVPSLAGVVVALIDESGQFAMGADALCVASPEAADCLYVPELDLCAFRLSTPAAGSAAESLLRSGTQQSLNRRDVEFDDRGIEIGIVYCIGSQWDSVQRIPIPYWSAYGRVVFADRLQRSDLGIEFVSLPAFKRAVRQQLFAHVMLTDDLQGLELTTPLDAILNAVLAKYECAADDFRRFLCFAPTKECRLAERSKNAIFRENPRVPCFCSDMPSRNGLSGSPVFQLKEGAHAVVGVHLARTGPEDAYLRPASLEYSRRAAPFHLLRSKLDAFEKTR